jgi:hypothetical protein
VLTVGARTRKALLSQGLWNTPIWPAGAGEDRAALSGRPRKANAGQSAGVMPQRNPARNRDATTRPSTKS